MEQPPESQEFGPTRKPKWIPLTEQSPESQEDGSTRKPKRRRKRLFICLWASLALIVVLGLISLILGLTVFKPKDPDTNVDSITLAGLDFSIDVLRLQVHLNLSLDTDVTVKNPNRVGFKYSNSTAFLRYRGNDVGQVAIPAGKIGARATRGMNVTLTLMADRLLSDPDFYADAISGTLPFQVHVRIPGKARILFNIHVVAYATCDIEIHPLSRTLINKICHYKTKL